MAISPDRKALTTRIHKSLWQRIKTRADKNHTRLSKETEILLIKALEIVEDEEKGLVNKVA